MSEFVPNTEYYGGYAHIKTDFSGDTHIYKIVNAIQSNSYCDVPVKVNSVPCLHDNIEPVLNVIHCGIDETRVVRVAVKDCDKILLPKSEVVRCKDCKYWAKQNDSQQRFCLLLTGKFPTGEWYCADAEREDEQWD